MKIQFYRIENEHLRNNQSLIKKVFNELKQIYFYPKMLNLITKFINYFETYVMAKYERNPNKLARKLRDNLTT